MNFKIGQIIHSAGTAYTTDFLSESTTSSDYNSIGTALGNFSEEDSNKRFLDYKILATGSFDKDKSYNLSFGINVSSTVTFRVYLIQRNSSNVIVNKQFLKEATYGTAAEIQAFNVSFSPNLNNTYNEIAVILNRTCEDISNGYPIEISSGVLGGRQLNISSVSLKEVKNIIEGSGPYKKLGIQASEGFPFIINGESFVVGQSGIWEMLNGIVTANYIGLPNPEYDNSFIIDYQE